MRRCSTDSAPMSQLTNKATNYDIDTNSLSMTLLAAAQSALGEGCQ
jgi:hypothetical protein